jgi:hypothetical protein
VWVGEGEDRFGVLDGAAFCGVAVDELTVLVIVNGVEYGGL